MQLYGPLKSACGLLPHRVTIPPSFGLPALAAPQPPGDGGQHGGRGTQGNQHEGKEGIGGRVCPQQDGAWKL